MCPGRVILLLDKRQIELAGVQLAVLASKNVAGAVSNRFQAIRNKKSLEEACNSYEEIINELIAERSQIIAIAQAHETELKRYTLGDEDIECLQGTASAALDVVASFSPSTNLESFESLKSLISVDTLKAMRLLPSATNCPLSTIPLDMRPAVGWPTSSNVVRECGHFLTGLSALWDYCFFGAQHLSLPSFMPTTGSIGQRCRRG